MIRKIVAAAAACFFPLRALAIDGVALEVGRGDDQTNLLRVSVQSDWNIDWFATRNWRVEGYWELSAGGWENHDASAGDFALTPVFRYARYAGDVRPYVEAAIGFHIVSHHISADRHFATNFQFGDHLGAGVLFGEGRRYDLGLRVQHISNGGIAEPNPGINFVLVRLQYRLQ